MLGFHSGRADGPGFWRLQVDSPYIHSPIFPRKLIETHEKPTVSVYLTPFLGRVGTVTAPSVLPGGMASYSQVY